MTEKQITKQLIKYCEQKEKETPLIKCGYYSKKKKVLQSNLTPR